ncbi:MAG: hypothetical protein QXH55_03240 [Candidatus Korarchaeota archaeon]|nr:hypothetical protein [Thermoproteota archaeon]MCR8473103.1 hypothetical protein [Thermoproteota archaeon]
MRVYRVRDKYSLIKVLDPYSIMTLLALRDAQRANAGDINRYCFKYGSPQPRTTTRKLADFKKYGLVEEEVVQKGGFIVEKIYRLSEKGKKLADVIAELLGEG